MKEIIILQESLNLIQKRKEFLCRAQPERYEKIMGAITKIINDNNLSNCETSDFFSLACVLNSIQKGNFKDITSSWIVLENQSR